MYLQKLSEKNPTYLISCIQIMQKYGVSYQLKHLVSGINLIKIITLNML